MEETSQPVQQAEPVQQQLEIKKEQARNGLQSISPDRRPDWVDELLAVLAPKRQDSEEGVPPASEAQEVQNRLAMKLRPKSSIGLRIAATEAPMSSGTNEEPPAERISMEEYERRSMEALKSIQEKRAEANAEKKRLKAAQAAKAKAGKPAAKSKDCAVKAKREEAQTPMKRPATSDVLKRPAASAGHGFAKRRPKCPKADNSKPVHYNGGVVYNPASQPAFRCIRTAGDYNTEKKCPWKDDMDGAWAAALKYIDDMRCEEASG